MLWNVYRKFAVFSFYAFQLYAAVVCFDDMQDIVQPESETGSTFFTVAYHGRSAFEFLENLSLLFQGDAHTVVCYTDMGISVGGGRRGYFYLHTLTRIFDGIVYQVTKNLA